MRKQFNIQCKGCLDCSFLHRLDRTANGKRNKRLEACRRDDHWVNMVLREWVP